MWSRLPSYELRLAGMQPSFDPGGTRYASADYVPTPGGNHLFVVDAETHKPTIIFHDPKRSVLGPQWSAKGDAIMFGIGPFGAFFNGFHDLFLGKADRVDGGAQIAMINADGTRLPRTDERARTTTGSRRWRPTARASSIARLVRTVTACGS